MTTIQIGDTSVTVLRDGVMRPPASILIHPEGEAATAALLQREGIETVELPVNAYLLRGQGMTVLIDAGGGNGGSIPGLGQSRDVLAQEGLTPDDIDAVLLTHMHSDHVRGLIEDGKPYFPRAHVFVPSIELLYFTDEDQRAAQPEHRRSAFDLAAQLGEILGSQIRMIGDGALPFGLQLIALPGHTPGHSGYRLAEGGKDLLFWGDIIHFEAGQIADPELRVVFDIDPALAVETRRDILSRLAGRGVIVAGAHINGLVTVEREGEGYSLRRL